MGSRWGSGLAALGAAVLSQAASAQSPSSSEAPSLSYQPGAGDERNFWRYFFFWKPETSVEAARADLLECGGYADGVILWARVPERMPLDTRPSGPNGTEGGYGLVGSIAFGLVEGGLTRRIVLANMRRCMGFKGYGRYGLSQGLWQQLNAGEPGEVVERQAAAATGPEPAQARLDP